MAENTEDTLAKSLEPLLKEMDKLSSRLEQSRSQTKEQLTDDISFDMHAESPSVVRERAASERYPMGFAPTGASRGGIGFMGGSPFPVQKGPQMTREVTAALVNVLSTIKEIQAAKKRKEAAQAQQP